jgi:hypothetical protein
MVSGTVEPTLMIRFSGVLDKGVLDVIVTVITIVDVAVECDEIRSIRASKLSERRGRVPR